MRKKGHNGLFITHQCPKYFNDVLFFVGLTALGTSINFNCLVHEVEYPNVLTSYCNPKSNV